MSYLTVQQNYFDALLNQILPDALMAEVGGIDWARDTRTGDLIACVKRRSDGGGCPVRLPEVSWDNITLTDMPRLTDVDKAKLVLFLA